jgi:RHS repeat-associated protein
VGATSITRAVAFDKDRLATKSGPFTIERKGPGGAVSKISDDKLSLSYEYDANGRPVGRTLKVGTAERFYQKLTFNNVGLAGAREERVDGGAPDTLTYGYDGVGQLLTVKRGATLLEDHAYDPDGNRLSGGAAYDDQDRLSVRGGVNYTWDADGFLKTRGADAFVYSRSGELLSAKGVTYSYDALGRRVARVFGGAKETYLYGNPANPWQVTASVVDDVVTTYYYDADERLFALERGGERYYVGADANGSVRVVVRASDGSVVRQVTYDAFGVETAVTGAFELPFGFAGGLRDSVTGVVRFGLRDYDPAAGRFLAKDPSFFSGSPENLYNYAGNNPVTMRDPSGLVCVGWSMYATIGGGFQFCRDNTWDWTADWSACVEAGAGAGGGIDVDAFGGASNTGATVFAELTGKAFWVGGTIGAELDLNCMQAKAGAKVMAGPVTIGADTGGGISVGGGQNDLPMPSVRLEGKVGVKVCKKW